MLVTVLIPRSLIPFKVDYKSDRNKEVTILDFFPSAENLKITETGIREIVGRLFYFVKN